MLDLSQIQQNIPKPNDECVDEKIDEAEMKVLHRVQRECGDTYMGETGGSLEVTLKEYQRAVKQHDNRNVKISPYEQHWELS